jgi:signal transduction histidine kinase
VRVERGRDVAEFLVTDDGQGLAAGETDAIFEPGYRGEAGAGNGDGAGLGLALARRLARAVGGDVETVSNGSGAGFRVKIPLSTT